MLNSLRSFASSPFGLVIFGVIILGLLAFGVGFSGRDDVIAKVGSQEITSQDYEIAYQNQLRGVAAVATSDIKQEVGVNVLWNLMLPRALINDHVGDLGLSLSDDAVAAAIAVAMMR